MIRPGKTVRHCSTLNEKLWAHWISTIVQWEEAKGTKEKEKFVIKEDYPSAKWGGIAKLASRSSDNTASDPWGNSHQTLIMVNKTNPYVSE